MHKLIIIISILSSLLLFSQKKIICIDGKQGVVFNSKEFNFKTILKNANEFELKFKDRHQHQFNDYVRQYSMENFGKRGILLFVILIPTEKSYDFKWRYEQYIGKSNLVRAVFFDVQSKYLSEVTWLRIKE